MSTPPVGEWAFDEGQVEDTAATLGKDLDLAVDMNEPTQPAPRYATPAEFVDDFLLEVVWTDVEVPSRTWCPQWWKHTAAIVRIEALHRSFEHLRLDPAIGVSVWLRDHADYHMAVLTDPNGIFKGCSPVKGHDAGRNRKIPSDPAPPGLFAADD